MNEDSELAPVPEVPLPDEPTPRRRRLGVALLTTALLACVIGGVVGAVAWFSGAVRIVETSAPSEALTSRTAAPPSPASTAMIPTPAPERTSTPRPTATPSAAPRTIPAADTRRQLRVQDTFAELVRQRYVYADFNGMNWDTAMREDSMRAHRGMSDEDFHRMLADRIDELGDAHSAFLSPEEAEDEDAEYSGELVYAGVGVVTFPLSHTDGLAVLQVYPNSPAANAGIRPHERIVRIDDQPAVGVDGNSNASLFRGEIGTPVSAVIRTPDGRERTVELVRAEVRADERVTHRRLTAGAGPIGYIAIPTLFEESIDEQVRAALEELQRDAPLAGLILDLRINGGGALDVLQPTLGFFTRGAIGSLYDRSAAEETIVVQARGVGRSQSVPIVVLIGPATESYAEVFAGALREKERAVLIGQRTAGNIETLRSHQFEDGSRLWLAEQSFRLPSGKSWEGVGLEPDMTIEAQWHEYDEANDPLVAAALATFP
jgi:C-terminal peptidase prc